MLRALKDMGFGGIVYGHRLTFIDDKLVHRFYHDKDKGHPTHGFPQILQWWWGSRHFPGSRLDYKCFPILAVKATKPFLPSTVHSDEHIPSRNHSIVQPGRDYIQQPSFPHQAQRSSRTLQYSSGSYSRAILDALYDRRRLTYMGTATNAGSGMVLGCESIGVCGG